MAEGALYHDDGGSAPSQLDLRPNNSAFHYPGDPLLAEVAVLWLPQKEGGVEDFATTHGE